MTTVMYQVNENHYVSDIGLTLKREFTGETPNGNPFGGRWVLRSPDGSYIDVDQYRNDMAERHNLEYN